MVAGRWGCEEAEEVSLLECSGPCVDVGVVFLAEVCCCCCSVRRADSPYLHQEAFPGGDSEETLRPASPSPRAGTGLGWPRRRCLFGGVRGIHLSGHRRPTSPDGTRAWPLGKWDRSGAPAVRGEMIPSQLAGGVSSAVTEIFIGNALSDLLSLRAMSVFKNGIAVLCVIFLPLSNWVKIGSFHSSQSTHTFH